MAEKELFHRNFEGRSPTTSAPLQPVFHNDTVDATAPGLVQGS